MSALLRAEGATYAIGRKILVSDVTLDLAPGRLVAVVGPNGAGKSTLLRLLAGEIRPAKGRILCDGRPITDVPPARLAAIRAVLPQSSRLAFPFTVAEVVRIGLDGMGRGLDAKAKARLLHEALAEADVTHLAGRTFQSLSGGEQQRAGFARILAQLAAGRTVADRQVLLLDEPVSSLDLKHQLGLMRTAEACARRGTAVLAILHDLNLAAAFADEIVAMRDGAVVAHGRPAEVITDALVRDVFDVGLRVRAVPADDRPFLIPDRDAT